MTGPSRGPRALEIVDRLTAAVGALCGLATIACVALVFALVVARYAFEASSQALTEAVLWLHAGAFLFGLAWALREDRHVRVDVLQQRWSARTAAWIEVAGGLLFLLPLCGFIFWMSWEYVAASWSVREGSREPGGLPALYLLKAMLPGAALLLAVQGLAQTLRALLRARGAGA